MANGSLGSTGGYADEGWCTDKLAGQMSTRWQYSHNQITKGAAKFSFISFFHLLMIFAFFIPTVYQAY